MMIWQQDLSQRKRLRNLAEHVPHGYQRRIIFEALIKHDVPLLRATWFVKIAYLNQVSTECLPPHGTFLIKLLGSFEEIMLQFFLFRKVDCNIMCHLSTRPYPSTCVLTLVSSFQVKPMSIGMSAGGPDKSQSKRVENWTKNLLEYAQWLLDDLCQSGGAPRTQFMSAGGVSSDAEPDVYTKWRYIVRLAQWHYSEGLLHRTLVVDWALKLLKVKKFMLY